MPRTRPTKFLHKPKPRGPKNPKLVAQMNANRLVTARLSMRHYVNGVAYGPGEVKVPHNLAEGMLHTEGHAVEVEEQFQSSKAVIIGPRRAGGHLIKEVPQETFDTEYANASPADVVKASNYGTDSKGGRPF